MYTKTKSCLSLYTPVYRIEIGFTEKEMTNR